MTARSPQRAEAHSEPRTDARVRTRTRAGADIDPFHIPAHLIPDGMSVEWKRATVFGQASPEYDMKMQAAGWEPVKTGLMPSLMPGGTDKNKPIVRDGMILCERPMELTEQARQEQIVEARGQVVGNAHSLRDAVKNIGDDMNAPRVEPRLAREFAEVEVPA